LLAKLDPAMPLREVIRRSGYQRDHLNSLIKRESGITLGQYRSQRRLALAKRLLTEQVRVSAVAAAVGLPDQSYFARWFRKQTGQQPSTWGRDWH
jgi:AraC family transcriptional activator of pobA